MTGRIVHTPPAPEHECAPPVPAHERPDPRYHDPKLGIPSAHPNGTVWQCECGRPWVTAGRRWHREGRLARRRRRQLNENGDNDG